MKERLWKLAPGDNHATPVTKREALKIAWDGGCGVIVVCAPTEIEAYRWASTWASLDGHDDVGDLGLDWTLVDSVAVLVSYA